MMKMREMGSQPSPQPQQQQAVPDLSQLPDEVLMELLQMLMSQGGGGLPGLESEDEDEEEMV